MRRKVVLQGGTAHDPIHPPGSASEPPSYTLKPVILEQLVPKNHVLARVDRVLDLGWLHEEVADCYCPRNARPGIGLVYL